MPIFSLQTNIADLLDTPPCQAKARSELFTVYQAENAVEIRFGRHDYPNTQIFCTCLSYESALKIGQLVSNSRKLPLREYLH